MHSEALQELPFSMIVCSLLERVPALLPKTLRLVLEVVTATFPPQDNYYLKFRFVFLNYQF